MRLGGAGRLLLAAAAGSLFVACTSDPPREPEPTAQQTQNASSSAAGDLRLTLERGFGLHAHLIAEAAQPRPAPVEAEAEAALERNAEALTDVVATAYSAEAAAEFSDAFDPYAAAVTGDGQDIDDAAQDLAAAMVDVTDETMDRSATTALVTDASGFLAEAVEATAARDHEQAYVARREAYAQMLAVGRAFAAGITEHLPEDYPGPRTSGALELRSALRQFLAEHTLLAVSVTRLGAVGAKDFSAAAAALAGNTEDLVDALRSEYDAGAEPFDEAWRARISALADYTVAAAEGDEEALDATGATLLRSNEDVARALAEMTGGAIGRRRAHRVLERSTGALTRQVDAWVAERYGEAWREQSRAHEHSASLADVIAEGIVADRPEEFPQ